MDNDSDWTATGLLSPSKAKAQQAQAKDWAFVDSWLTKRSASKRLPSFERNEDTLQALLSLVTVNDAADEHRSAVDRVEKAALSALAKRTETNTECLHEYISKHLETDSGIDTLAELSVLLDTTCPSSFEIGNAIIDLSETCFANGQQILRTEYQLQALKAEQERVKAILVSLEDNALQPPLDLPEQTAEWVRSSKQLRAKVAEYDDRLASAGAEAESSMMFGDLERSVADLEEQETKLLRLDSELAAFQSLPSDGKGARAKLEAAREDLRKLAKQRDTLFEEMAGA